MVYAQLTATVALIDVKEISAGDGAQLDQALCKIAPWPLKAGGLFFIVLEKMNLF